MSDRLLRDGDSDRDLPAGAGFVTTDMHLCWRCLRMAEGPPWVHDCPKDHLLLIDGSIAEPGDIA